MKLYQIYSCGKQGSDDASRNARGICWPKCNTCFVVRMKYSDKSTILMTFVSMRAHAWILFDSLYCSGSSNGERSANAVTCIYYSTPENDMMAFIDDDSLMDEHNRRDECRALSPSMSLRPPHLQNGWGSSVNQRIKQQQQQQQQSLRKPVQVASSNVNNNNNNNNSNANAGNGYCSDYKSVLFNRTF